MTREIKFRAFEKKSKQMLPVEQWANKSWIAVPVQVGEDEWELNQIPLSDVELMQYTGLKDKNGREIYEGDILRGDDTGLGEVKWRDDGWTLSFEEGIASLGETLDNFEQEVIGNIHENKDLLV